MTKISSDFSFSEANKAYRPHCKACGVEMAVAKSEASPERLRARHKKYSHPAAALYAAWGIGVNK
jgi:hypothetical protein